MVFTADGKKTPRVLNLNCLPNELLHGGRRNAACPVELYSSTMYACDSFEKACGASGTSTTYAGVAASDTVAAEVVDYLGEPEPTAPAAPATVVEISTDAPGTTREDVSELVASLQMLMVTLQVQLDLCRHTGTMDSSVVGPNVKTALEKFRQLDDLIQAKDGNGDG